MTRSRDDYNPVIFGKNRVQKVTSIEVRDGFTDIFTEDGVISEPNLFWSLTSKPKSPNDIRLEGKLHYKYAHVFENREDWQNFNRKQPRGTLLTAWNDKENSQIIKGITSFKGMGPKDVSVLSWDIETSGLVQNESSFIYIISSVFRHRDKIVKKLFSYDQFENQAALINAWCDWVREMNPAILLAYNGNGYDIPYMLHVAKMHGTELRLGRDGSALTQRPKPSQFRKDGSQSYTYYKPICYGREVIDQMFVTIRYDIRRNFSSYALKTVIKEAGLEKPGRTFVDAGNIKDMVKDPFAWEQVKAYAMDDAEDTLNLFDKTIAAQFYSAQVIPKPFQAITESATGSQINAVLIREYMRKRHSIPRDEPVAPYPGGISIAIPGLYKNGLQLDLSNLYPSIIMQYRPYNTFKDPLGVFYETLKYFREERLVHKRLYAETKDEYHNGFQEAFKVIANSYYGFLGAPGLEFNNPKGAAIITGHARRILSQAIKFFTGRTVSDISKEIDGKGDGVEED